MSDVPPAPVDDVVAPAGSAAPAAPAQLPMTEKPDGTLVIDLLPLAPPPPGECLAEEPDPLNPEILVCRKTAPSPRIGPDILPDSDDFASGIPRARVQLSERAAAEANATNPSVGGWNAQGAELRLKIDF